MGILESLALALGAAWGSGLSLYATVLVLGGLDLLGLVDLPSGLDMLSSPAVLGFAGLLFLIEFVADKVPGVDTLWDLFHTLIRIPAGALMAMGAMEGAAGGLPAGLDPEVAAIAALLIGGTVSAGTHFAKAGGRAVINTSPEPFSNWLASLVEDVMVVLGVMAAVTAPLLFLVLFGLFLLLLAWLLPRIWRGIRYIFSSLRRPHRAARRRTRPQRGFELTGPSDPG